MHSKKIYHSDIKPANILLTSNDDIKLCDFGIAVQIHTESSATSSHAKGEVSFMSPERLNGASRSTENDIWSIGATFVTMITGHPLNHHEKFPIIHLSQSVIFIDSKPLIEYLQALSENDYRREIISLTLCPPNNRLNSHELWKVCQRLSLFTNSDQPITDTALSNGYSSTASARPFGLVIPSFSESIGSLQNASESAISNTSN